MVEIEKLTNMLGEALTEDELDEAVKIVRSLSLKEIDGLWYELGWVDSETNFIFYKSLPKSRLEKIKANEEYARNFLLTTFQETTPKKEFLEKIKQRDRELK